MQSTLEELLDQLDREWTGQGSCDLDRFMQKLHSAPMEMLVELCVADYEWRCRSLGTNPQPPSAQTIPRVSAYRRYLGSHWENPACQRVLLQSEWLARSVWGDKPRIDAFLAEASLATASANVATMRSELLESLNLSVQLEIRLQIQDRDLLTVLCPSAFCIGRQKVGEPPPPYWDVTTSRLVAWPVTSVQYSREQLQLQRVRTLEMRIANISDGRALRVSGQDLLPRQSGHFHIPIVIETSGTTITLAPVDTSFPRVKHR